MTIHNMMEDVVKYCLKDWLTSGGNGLELDEKMQADVMAIALNNLPPKYVSSAKGEMFVQTQLRSQVETDVYRELSRAIEKVTQNKRESVLQEEAPK